MAWILCVGVTQCYVSKVAPINYISSPPSISATKDCPGPSVNRDFKNTDNTSSLLFVKVARECSDQDDGRKSPQTVLSLSLTYRLGPGRTGLDGLGWKI